MTGSGGVLVGVCLCEFDSVVVLVIGDFVTVLVGSTVDVGVTYTDVNLGGILPPPGDYPWTG